MSVEDVSLRVGDDRYPGRLTVPDEPTDRGIIVIPGAGHGPFGDVFDRFATAAADAGFAVARFRTWADVDDLEAKTSADFAADLDAGVDFLRDGGCDTVSVVAKSFGGRLALEYPPDDLDRLVLWAPAVRFGADAADPSIEPADLASLDRPVRILQGDDDDTVPLENSRQIAEALPQGEVVVLEGEDHSFLTDQDRVVGETLAFLED
ncbi:alpha/beta hydrolase [Halobacteriales archaeon Cl-PHB]